MPAEISLNSNDVSCVWSMHGSLQFFLENLDSHFRTETTASGISITFSQPMSPANQCFTDPASAAIPSSSASVSGCQRQLRGGQVLAEVGDRRCAGDQQDVGRPVQEPRQRDLHRRGPKPPRDVRQSRRLQRREPAEREERHVRDALPGQVIDQGVVVAVGQVVVVLHADDLGDRLRLGDLGGRDVAEADVADQSLRA